MLVVVIIFRSWLRWYYSVYIVTNLRIRQQIQQGLFRKTAVDVYLDKVDNGQELFLESDKGQIYQIISDPHTFQDVPPEYILEPDEELERALTPEQFLAQVKENLQLIFQNEK